MARLGQAGLGRARQGGVRRCPARLGRAWQGIVAGHGTAGRGEVWQSNARHGIVAGPGTVRLGRAGPGLVTQCKAMFALEVPVLLVLIKARSKVTPITN